MNDLKKIIIFTLSAFALFDDAVAQEKLYNHSFSLKDVKLLESPFKHARDLNVEVLLSYDVDRLLAPYLKEAGLEPKAPSFENWIGLDGHIGGHYLTGLAIHYAATGDLRCKERLEYVVEELKRCQDMHGNGYVGGIPNGKNLWKEIESGNVGIVWQYWVPWYNLHKTYAGLRDAWLYAGNEDAKSMFLKLCDWGVNLMSNLDDKQMESMLANEFGGMNEVYADAFQMTQDNRYLTLAKRFSHKEIFDAMSRKEDNLDNLHANTQVPKAVGYQRVAELTHDSIYTTAATFFWQTVVNNRSLSLGGNSRREHFPAEQDFLSYIEEREGPESCNTNNMLKLAGGLFRMNPDATYMDYYEKALYNHILSTQHPEHGGYVYFTSARPAHYRVYSQVNSAMWCCVGTGMENHGKYGELIYSHNHDSLYVNLFIASELDWKERGVKLVQQTNFPIEGNSTIRISLSKKSENLKLYIRYPGWVPKGELSVIVDGKDYAMNNAPQSYVLIDRQWNNGDEIQINMPMNFHLEELKNNPEFVSIFRGPILMGAKVGTEGLNGLVAGDHRWGHIASGPLVSIFDTPVLLGDRQDFIKQLNTIENNSRESLSFTLPKSFVKNEYQNINLEPFYNIHDSRYMMYWLSMTNQDFIKLQDQLKKEEKAKLELDAKTIDFIKVGEQQPEVDHRMKELNTQKGIHDGNSWREVSSDGMLTYELQTKNKDNLTLHITYWGYEGQNRAFDILINNHVLASEDLSGKWNQSKFFDVKYEIPQEWLTDKDNFVLSFKARSGNRAGRIFKIRLVEE